MIIDYLLTFGCTMKRIDTIAFDFDGTLAELTIDFKLMKQRLRALASAFLDPIPETPELPALELLNFLAETIGREEESLGAEFHSRGRLMISAMELDAAKKGSLFEFARPLLAKLRERGLKSVIITRNSTAAVKIVFPDILDRCDAFVPREDVCRVKPHPEHLLTALKKCGSIPEKTLMVGDHVFDIELGKRAGAYTAAVVSGTSSAEELARESPDFMVNNCMTLWEFAVDKELI